jgi:transcriptional regulator with XRE-family HTH domain
MRKDKGAKGKETVNERVKLLRKTLGMTQVEFAEKLGIYGGSISVIEAGVRTGVTNQNIFLICTPNRLQDGKTVNQDWLRTGKGEMFIPQPSADERLKLFEDGKELPPEEAELIGVYRELLPENKKFIREKIHDTLMVQRNTLGIEKGESVG